jgi:hypothetical protein
MLPPAAALAELLPLLEPGVTKDVAGKVLSPEPLGGEVLAALRLPDGGPLPEELGAWLRFDASWFALDDEGGLPIGTLRGVFERWAEDMLGELAAQQAEGGEPAAADSGPITWTSEQMVDAWISMLPDARLADAAALELRYTPGSQEHILILEPGVVRVLGSDQRFELWWKYHSLAALVAHWYQLSGEEQG